MSNGLKVREIAKHFNISSNRIYAWQNMGCLIHDWSLKEIDTWRKKNIGSPSRNKGVMNKKVYKKILNTNFQKIKKYIRVTEFTKMLEISYFTVIHWERAGVIKLDKDYEGRKIIRRPEIDKLIVAARKVLGE